MYKKIKAKKEKSNYRRLNYDTWSISAKSGDTPLIEEKQKILMWIQINRAKTIIEREVEDKNYHIQTWDSSFLHLSYVQLNRKLKWRNFKEKPTKMKNLAKKSKGSRCDEMMKVL